MVDFNRLLILVFVFLTSCQAQRYPPTNLRAVYSATDGTIRVTWDPPSPSTTNIDTYYVTVNDTGGHVQADDRRVYLYNNTKPNTEYPIKVTTNKGRVVGRSSTTIITLPTIYRQKGTRIRLKLPKPPGGISAIAFNGQTLFTLFDDGIIEDKTNTTMISVTVSVTSTDTELEITTLTTQYAGYYYLMMSSGNEILGGKLLVVTDTPSPPTIIPDNSSPVVDTAVTLGCSSSSRSKPDNHGLVLTASWKLNGTVISHARFSVSGTGLTIHQVRNRDKYNVYTCVTTETGQGVSLSSGESPGFKLTPRYGPQFVRIEGTDGKSPVIRGDVYGPVVCRTDCNPPCSMEWRRQGIAFIQSNTASNNSLVLVDNSLPRIREVTYTCLAGVPSTAGFTAPTKEEKLNIEVHFPPNITELRYRDGVDNPFKRIGSGDVRYTEGSSLELRVVVDSSPPADVTLSHDQTTVAGSTTGNYDIKLDDLQCDHTGRYEVRATNYVTRNRSNISPSSRQFGLQVSCVPRRQDRGNGVIGVLGRKFQTVTLNVTVIANPQPTGRWSGIVRPLNVLPINAYMYTLSGQVTINPQSDFRDYYVNISNSVPGSLTVSFKIRAEDVPDVPIDFQETDVGFDSIKVMWTSGFNGGNDQLFHIEIMTTGKEWSPYILNISDLGQGVVMNHMLSDLTSSTDYVIRLNVSNKIGLGNSSVIEVRTLVKPKPLNEQSSSTTIIVVVVVIVLLLVVVAAVLGIFIIRRKKAQQGGAARNSVVRTDNDNNEYAVVCKPPKGGAARSSAVRTDNDNNEYAVVYKPPKGGAAKTAALNTDDNNEYAVVCKPAKGKKQNSKEPKPGPSSQNPQPGPSRTVNEDGLIYIDVDIKPRPGGPTGIIHGDDDRTEYTFVDFSKTAPNPD